MKIQFLEDATSGGDMARLPVFILEELSSAESLKYKAKRKTIDKTNHSPIFVIV
jgi:hypothetical protein